MGLDEDMMNHEEPDEYDDERDFSGLKRGTIIEFQGSYMSGLAMLVVKDENDMVKYVSCENTSMVKALESAFGNVISNSHNVKSDGGHVGKDIFYHVDDFGVIEWFIPVEDAPKEIIQMYNMMNGKMGVPNFGM